MTRDRSGRIKRLLVQDQPLRGAAKPRARVRLWPNEWTHDAMCGIERYKRIKPVAVVDAMLREKREKREKREGVQA
ncbi:MAG TPA: hypothetical protein EYQ27_15215 [Gemmatimonadetes bacterium]|nr:hypothetical protein [Gemmatimonadota bacterium]